MTSITFNLNTFRLNINGRPKTFNLNILKAYRVKLMCGEKTKTFRCTCKNVSETSVTMPSVCGGMEGIKVLMTVLLCHRQQKL